MRLIESYSKHIDKHEWECYDSHTEFSQSEHYALHNPNLLDAKPGEYIKSNNGWYLPIISKIEHKRGKTQYTLIKIRVPKHYILINRNDLTGKIIKYSFHFDPDGQRARHTFKTVRLKFFAKLVANNVDIYTAYRKAYLTGERRTIQLHILDKLISSDIFYEVLKEHGYMKTLKNELEAEGVTITSIAKKLKDLIEDPDTPAPTLKWAMDLAIKYLEEKTTEVKINQLNIQQNQIDKLIGTANNPGGISVHPLSELEQEQFRTDEFQEVEST